MHGISDIPDGALDTPDAAGGAALREHVLTLTSTLRAELDRLVGRRDSAAIDRLRGVGGAIVAVGARAQMAPLVHSAEGFCDLALGTAESVSAVDGLLHAVGLIERVLDGCLTGMDAEHLDRLCGAAREVGLDDDADDALDLTLDAAPRVGVAEPDDLDRPTRATMRDVHEQELFDAFAAEALDILDQCEEQVLRYELDPHAYRLDDVGVDLTTIRDAAAAVGLPDLEAPSDVTAVDALLDCIDATRQRIEDAWADSPAAGVDPSMLLPVDELFLRLRRGARDVARRHGGLLALATHGGELRITAALADRIYEPFARMIDDAASHVVPGGLRTVRLRVDRDDGMLALIIDEDPAASDGAGADGERPEALYWIDARRPASDDETARLVYRPGAVNVVQVITG